MTCMAKGMMHKYYSNQSILFGKTMGIAVNIIGINLEAENLDQETADRLLSMVEFKQEPFEYDGGAQSNWQDEPGLDLHRFGASFTVTEQIGE